MKQLYNQQTPNNVTKSSSDAAELTNQLLEAVAGPSKQSYDIERLSDWGVPTAIVRRRARKLIRRTTSRPWRSWVVSDRSDSKTSLDRPVPSY